MINLILTTGPGGSSIYLRVFVCRLWRRLSDACPLFIGRSRTLRLLAFREGLLRATLLCLRLPRLFLTCPSFFSRNRAWLFGLLECQPNLGALRKIYLLLGIVLWILPSCRVAVFCSWHIEWFHQNLLPPCSSPWSLIFEWGILLSWQQLSLIVQSSGALSARKDSRLLGCLWQSFFKFLLLWSLFHEACTLHCAQEYQSALLFPWELQQLFAWIRNLQVRKESIKCHCDWFLFSCFQLHLNLFFDLCKGGRHRLPL